MCITSVIINFVKRMLSPSFILQCFGVMEGVNYSDLIAEGKLAGVKSILHYTPPGAETIDEFTSRAMDFFCEMCKYVCYTTKLMCLFFLSPA